MSQCVCRQRPPQYPTLLHPPHRSSASPIGGPPHRAQVCGGGAGGGGLAGVRTLTMFEVESGVAGGVGTRLRGRECGAATFWFKHASSANPAHQETCIKTTHSVVDEGGPMHAAAVFLERINIRRLALGRHAKAEWPMADGGARSGELQAN